MRKFKIIIVTLILATVFCLIPKPLIVNNLPNSDWWDICNFVYYDSVVGNRGFGGGWCLEYSIKLKNEATTYGLKCGLVVGWHDGVHAWNAFKVNDVIHYVEPQRIGYIWSDSRPGYTPWIIISW